MAHTVREWRRIKEISQQTVADAIGVHVNTYARWEKDAADMPIRAGFILAQLLGVSVDDIIFDPTLQNVG